MRRWIIFICCLAPLLAIADERILDYQSDIRIHENGVLTVTETIRVRAEGKNIRRGIYRDFPTRYKDRFGNRFRVDFDVISVRRNGQPEPWHTEKRSNGIRVYFGSAGHYLDHGEHEYELVFLTNRQIGFFKEHDELWWNVTGNGWMFPIDHVTATVSFPFTFTPGELELSVYTGRYGSKESRAIAEVLNSGKARFETTAPLEPWEGMSVIAAWPKGRVAEPGFVQKTAWFARDNGAAIILFFGLILPLAWYYWSWNKVGRDPEKGVIIPRFKPPDGLSPAACRYVKDMSFNRNAFTAAVISLAVKGQLVIEEEDEEFTLELWWNVTGNGWMFPIDHVTATVSFPFTFTPGELELSVYTGRYGSKESRAIAEVLNSGKARFETTAPLEPWEGMSVIAAWPKGRVAEPGFVQKTAWFARDNGAAIILFFGLILPLAWYYWSWNKVGRDPEKGVIIPRFKPPDGLSPAACRYVKDMSFNRNAFTAAVISLAVKGQLVIEEEDEEFTLRRETGTPATALTKGERVTLDELLPLPGSSIQMDNENYKDFQSAKRMLKKELKKEYLGRLFHLNSVYMAPPVLMSIAAAVIAAFFTGGTSRLGHIPRADHGFAWGV